MPLRACVLVCVLVLILTIRLISFEAARGKTNAAMIIATNFSPSHDADVLVHSRTYEDGSLYFLLSTRALPTHTHTKYTRDTHTRYTQNTYTRLCR
jgi:hypothetical protein